MSAVLKPRRLLAAFLVTVATLLFATSAFASAGTGLRWTQPFWLTARAQCPASDGGEPTELVIPLSVRGMSPTEVIELLNRYRLTALGAAER